MKGSLIIIGFFLLGIVCGLTDAIPDHLLDDNLSLYALCALMFCVGVSIGMSKYPGNLCNWIWHYRCRITTFWIFKESVFAWNAN